MDSAHDLAIREGTTDDWAGVFRLLLGAFHDSHDDDLERTERGVFEPERALVITDGDELVANAAAFTRELTVPGAIVPAAHVSLVSVAATHRRRGLLRRLMQRQLTELHEAGREPIAVLWASEGRIYPRFGYGMAAAKLSFEVNSREVHLPAPGPTAGRLRTSTPESVRNELAKVYEQVRADRPGWSSRDERWWAYRLSDISSRRHGATEQRATLHEGQSGVDGYALWRAKGTWEGGIPTGQVRVGEIMATNPEAYLGLWRFLLSVDLTRSVDFFFGTADEPLFLLANEPRELGARLSDALWLRVVDVGAALVARRYAAPVDVVIEVSDAMLPANAGRWRLTADGTGRATCTRTDAEADLAMDVTALGAAYLGGVSLGALAAAGRVHEPRPGALPRASAAFGWHRAPSSIEIF